ncbi:barstar family protein [Candidatus Mycobacterium wuenschmannii]|uniref:Barstar family protein n=1 Tax=Candidatus Mycobacterium wuenschmannii TaxID=3027808 RepID=A0ABY8VSZ6_9MYCO|nr:barstar family protein [Candidatus Mycobacterium wuenschmannii]WIM86750.1 barstar family protein [Candidatus Mycobacterium wuenschmannii]
MTRDTASGRPVTYTIDGRKIKSASDFYREIGAAVNGPGGYFGRNLDALADCLRGGFGTPDRGRFEFEWQHSALSRQRLGDSGTAKSAVFESIQDVFRDAGVPLHLK